MAKSARYFALQERDSLAPMLCLVISQKLFSFNYAQIKENGTVWRHRKLFVVRWRYKEKYEEMLKKTKYKKSLFKCKPVVAIFLFAADVPQLVMENCQLFAIGWHQATTYGNRWCGMGCHSHRRNFVSMLHAFFTNLFAEVTKKATTSSCSAARAEGGESLVVENNESLKSVHEWKLLELSWNCESREG